MARLLESKRVEAELVKQRIRELDFAGFQDPGWSQVLPFPGHSTARIGKRPPREFEFVGRSAYTDVITMVLVVDQNRGLIITGARGKGKSCILRAVAAELIGRHQRVICMWYLDARAPLLTQVVEALLFAYNDSDEAVQGIGHICSQETLAKFLEWRKATGEFIVFVSDGAENYDEQHKDGGPRRNEEARRLEARKWLDVLDTGCCYIIKTVSPEANDSVAVIGMKAYELKDNFGKEAFDSFIRTNSTLGAMLSNHPDREEDVRLFAGNHPLSLFCLSNACDQYVQDVTHTSPSKRLRVGIGVLDVRTGKEMSVYSDAVEQPESYLDDEQDWQAVLLKFKQGEPFKSIRETIKSYKGPEESLRTPALVSRSFVSSDGLFCSDFIYAVHLEAALERLKDQVFRSPAFREYVKVKIDDPNVIWAEIGWACEGFVADAIMAVGLKFKGQILRPVELRSLAGEPVLLDASRWEPLKPVYLRPGKHSFKYVDGVIAWIDENRLMHFLALQVTVSPENHTKTEFKFMDRDEAKRWYTGNCVWYYVYVCPAKVLELEAAPSGGGSISVVEYKREQLQLDECFEQNMGQAELLLLRELASVREREMKRRREAKATQAREYQQLLKSLPPGKQALYKRLKTRERLEAEAKKRGITDPSRKKFKNVYSLLSAI